VRVEELLIAITAKPLGECALCPVKRHRVHYHFDRIREVEREAQRRLPES
jgi:hypothetical protein